MAWRERGGRRRGWEESVAMVASPALPLRRATALGEDREATGLCKEPRAATRCQGKGKEGRVRGRSGRGFTTLGLGGPGSQAPAPSFLPPRWLGSWEELGWAGGRGRPDGRVRPTPPSHRGPGEGPAPRAGGMRAGGQQACRIQVTGGRCPGRWGSHPQVSLNRPQTRGRGGRGTGWRPREAWPTAQPALLPR